MAQLFQVTGKRTKLARVNGARTSSGAGGKKSMIEQLTNHLHSYAIIYSDSEKK